MPEVHSFFQHLGFFTTTWLLHRTHPKLLLTFQYLLTSYWNWLLFFLFCAHFNNFSFEFVLANCYWCILFLTWGLCLLLWWLGFWDYILLHSYSFLHCSYSLSLSLSFSLCDPYHWAFLHCSYSLSLSLSVTVIIGLFSIVLIASLSLSVTLIIGLLSLSLSLSLSLCLEFLVNKVK